jgi:aldose 1-epimerase
MGLFYVKYHIFILITISLFTNSCEDYMKKDSQFSYIIEKDSETGWSVVTLQYEDKKEPSQNKSVKICPDGGANLFSFKIGEYEILHQPSSLKDLMSVYFGVPVLYPTPNRVRDCKYSFMEKEIRQIKNGKERYIHGLVYDEPWEFEEPLVDKSSIKLKTHINITKDHNLFSSFPFENTIRLDFILLKDKIRFEYEVENQGKNPIPYGFGLHPWFKTFGERKDNVIEASVNKTFEAINLLPTGKLLDVKDTPRDIRKPTSIENLDLDNVYFGVNPKTKVSFLYKSINLQVSLKASEDFTHLVVYTPIKKNYFCIENQTCSTDAHNMYTKGYKDIAHLLIVKPRKKMNGWIEFIPKWIKK